jgi:hypothetical protein
MPKLLDSAEALRFVQDRIDTREWWILPVAEPVGARMALDIIERHYTGDNRLLVDMLLVQPELPDVPFLYIILAAKSCMSPQQLSDATGVPLPDDARDALIPSSTPASVVLWFGNQFRWMSE